MKILDLGKEALFRHICTPCFILSQEVSWPLLCLCFSLRMVGILGIIETQAFQLLTKMLPYLIRPYYILWTSSSSSHDTSLSANLNLDFEDYREHI